MNIDRYKDDVDRLIDQGERLYAALVLQHHPKDHAKFGLTKEQVEKLPNIYQDYQAGIRNR